MKAILIERVLKIILIVILTSSYSISGYAQYTCITPHIISSLPFISSGTTSTGPSYQASDFCGQNTNYNEQDYIYSYTPVVDESLNIYIEHNNFLTTCGIYVFTDCAQPPTECVTFQEGTHSAEAYFIANAGQEYFIFIGTATTDQFTIEVTKESVEGVAINKVEPTQTLDVNGAIRIGESTTTPYKGTIRWNETTDKFEGFDGSEWNLMSHYVFSDLGDVYKNGSSLFFPINDTIASYTGANNIAIGYGSLNSLNGFNNSLLGATAGGTITTGSHNVIMGSSAGRGGFSSSENVYLGSFSGNGLSIANQKGNVYIGYNSGRVSSPNLVGEGNVFLGWQSGKGMSLSNKLIIDNNNLDPINSEAPLLFGDFEDDFIQINGSQRFTENEVFGINGECQIGWDTVSFNIKVNSNDNLTPCAAIGFIMDDVMKGQITLNGTGKMLFDINGATQAQLSDEGDFAISGETANKTTPGEWVGFSDARLKKEIIPLDKQSMLKKVLSMQGVNYLWNDNVTGIDRPEGIQTGFIAQELQELYPENIRTDVNGYLKTAYGTYDPVFVEAMKALHEIVQNQAKEIEILKSKMEELTK